MTPAWPLTRTRTPPAPQLQVVFGTEHDPRQFTARAANPDPQDGQHVSAPRFASVVTDAHSGFGFYEILPLLVRPLQ